MVPRRRSDEDYVINETDVSSAPLTKHEIMSLRRIIRSDDRARWFWTTVRIWTAWLIGIPAAIVAIWQILKGGGGHG